MLSQCANAQCSKTFLRLREGKLFMVETDRLQKPGEAPTPVARRAVEHFWLCDECAAQWTLVYDPKQGISLAPVRRPATVTGTPLVSRAGAA